MCLIDDYKIDLKRGSGHRYQLIACRLMGTLLHEGYRGGEINS